MYSVCIVGLGKIGLPLGVQFATSGMSVIGADINPSVISTVLAGDAPFPGEPDLEQRLRAAIAAGRFDATTDTPDAVSRSNVVIVVVPLLVDHDTKEPAFRGIDAAATAVGRGLQRGTLVCFETTLPVGTTRHRFSAILERESGLAAGTDFFVCFSPERVSSGSVFADLRKYPKLVGGINDASTAAGVAFYQAGLQFDERTDLPRPNGVWAMGSSEGAELAKLAETTYRDINIAFANELARYCDGIGIDAGEVIAASNSQPYSHIHQPGIAVGGHCIPVYPHLYLQSDPVAQMPAASRRVNDAMPAYGIDRLEALLGAPVTGLKVAILGLAYRGGVKETALSGAWSLVEELGKRGATVTVEDPIYTDAELVEFGLAPHHLGEQADAVIIQSDHREYRVLTPADVPGARAIVDGRNVLGPLEPWIEAGVRVAVLGRREA